MDYSAQDMVVWDDRGGPVRAIQDHGDICLTRASDS